jgi:hypothetical protein
MVPTPPAQKDRTFFRLQRSEWQRLPSREREHTSRRRTVSTHYEHVSNVSGMRCLTFLWATGVHFYVLWNPQSRSEQLRASISPPHLALRGSVDDNCTSHVHPQRCWPCVFSCLLSHLCFLSASRPSHDRVSGACAAAVAEVSVAALNFFLRLRRACLWLLLSPAAGLGARFVGSLFWAASFHCSIAADQPGARQRHGA